MCRRAPTRTAMINVIRSCVDTVVGAVVARDTEGTPIPTALVVSAARSISDSTSCRKHQVRAAVACPHYSSERARDRSRAERQSLPFVCSIWRPSSCPPRSPGAFGLCYALGSRSARSSQFRPFAATTILAMSKQRRPARTSRKPCRNVGAPFGLGQFRAPVRTPFRLRKLRCEPAAAARASKGSRAHVVHEPATPPRDRQLV